MSVFLKRQQVEHRRQWVKRLRQMERILLSMMVVIIGLFSLYGLYRVIFLGSIFQVKRIVVEGTFRQLTPAGVAALTGVHEGDSLFRVSVEGLHKKLSTEPWIKEAAVSRRLPDTLWIHIEEYEPRAMVLSRGLYYIDADGKIIKRVEPDEAKDFPVQNGVEVREDMTFSEEDAAHVKEMLGIAERFRGSNFGSHRDISEISFDPVAGYSIITRNEPMQIYLGEGDAFERIAQIDRIIGAVAAREGRIQYMRANEDGRIIIRYRSS